MGDSDTGCTEHSVYIYSNPFFINAEKKLHHSMHARLRGVYGMALMSHTTDNYFIEMTVHGTRQFGMSERKLVTMSNSCDYNYMDGFDEAIEDKNEDSEFEEFNNQLLDSESASDNEIEDDDKEEEKETI
eukprot:3528942-Ditylum_brightwellii.AAC.1